jgi:glycosyltransferase involved in cell wall biosynthesis
MTRSVAIIGTRGYPSYYGGFETAVRQLAPFLAESGWDVTVYGRPGATSDRDASLDSRVKRVTTWGIESKSLSTLSYGLTASLDAMRTKPDVALVMNVANGYFLPALRARGIPTLVNVDGIEWDRAKWGRAAKAVFRTGASWTAKFGTELVCDSTEIAKRWAKDFGREGIFIPYGGDIPEAIPVEPGLTRRGYVLVVARFVPENSIVEFIEAAAELGKQHQIVIVGSSGYGGEVEERVRLLAEHNPRITWLGHVSDDQRLLGLWQNCGAYFHGHSVGGTNPALVQAMACGAPVVARDTVYNREVLGKTGYFVEATSTAIASGLRRVLADPRLQSDLSSSAVDRARDGYSWLAVNQKYERALTRLVDSPGRQSK